MWVKITVPVTALLSDNGKALIGGYAHALWSEVQLTGLKPGEWFIEHCTEGK